VNKAYRAAGCAAVVLAACLAAFALVSRQREQHRAQETFFAMDTPVTLTAYGSNAVSGLAAARQAIAALEDEVSVTRPHSAVARLNAGGALPDGGTVGPLLDLAFAVGQETGGAFDPTLYPLVRAWGFTTGTQRVPASDELKSLLKYTGAERVVRANGTLRLRHGSMIDLGGIGKGWASDAAVEALKAAGVTSAVVNLGGNVRTLGTRPGGGAWRIGVRDPEGGLLGVLQTGEGAVVTSGSYERYFERMGQRYWHILDPKTGGPARSGVVSVTVVGPSGARCDALSTALFVLGPKRAAEWKRSGGREGFIMLTDGGELLLTADLAAAFTPDEAWKDAKVTVIRP